MGGRAGPVLHHPKAASLREQRPGLCEAGVQCQAADHSAGLGVVLWGQTDRQTLRARAQPRCHTYPHYQEGT